MEHVRRFIRHNGIEFKDLYRHAVWAGSERYRTVRAGGLYVWGDQVVFAETVRGRDQRWELWSDFRFGPQFDGGLFLRGSTVWRGENDSKFAEVLIPRLRVSYQFNKELSLRLIGEMQSRKTYDVNDALVDESNAHARRAAELLRAARHGALPGLRLDPHGQERDLRSRCSRACSPR